VQFGGGIVRDGWLEARGWREGVVEKGEAERLFEGNEGIKALEAEERDSGV